MQDEKPIKKKGIKGEKRKELKKMFSSGRVKREKKSKDDRKSPRKEEETKQPKPPKTKKEKKKREKKKEKKKKTTTTTTTKQPKAKTEEASSLEASSPLGRCLEECGCEEFYGDGKECQNCGHQREQHEKARQATAVTVTSLDLPKKREKGEDSEEEDEESEENEEEGEGEEDSDADDEVEKYSDSKKKKSAPVSPSSAAASSSSASSSAQTMEIAVAPLTVEEMTRKFKECIIDGLVTNFSWEINAKELDFQQRMGEGASAKVYKAAYRGQTVAIKLLKDRVDAAQIRDFKKEFALFGSVRSPHIVFFYGACLQPSLCLVMEWCENGSLYDLMNNKNFTRSFDWPFFFRITTQTVRGLKCLHEWKPCIVHRDLKSLNLLVDHGLTVKVADFGLSRSAEDNLSTLNKLRGTYAYTAPEVYFGERYTTKADVFSLAIIFWEVLYRTLHGCYRGPYADHKQLIFDFQVIIQTAKNNLRPTLPKKTPKAIRELLEDCWAKEVERRPSSADLLTRLREVEKEYEANKAEWDQCIEASSSSS
ncbi:Constitutive triple response 4 [Balamuthia mandrillaris]